LFTCLSTGLHTQKDELQFKHSQTKHTIKYYLQVVLWLLGRGPFLSGFHRV
jgi:hypothetical protein